jgi:hypothetical protein
MDMEIERVVTGDLNKSIEQCVTLLMDVERKVHSLKNELAQTLGTAPIQRNVATGVLGYPSFVPGTMAQPFGVPTVAPTLAQGFVPPTEGIAVAQPRVATPLPTSAPLVGPVQAPIQALPQGFVNTPTLPFGAAFQTPLGFVVARDTLPQGFAPTHVPLQTVLPQFGIQTLPQGWTALPNLPYQGFQGLQGFQGFPGVGALPATLPALGTLPFGAGQGFHGVPTIGALPTIGSLPTLAGLPPMGNVQGYPLQPFGSVAPTLAPVANVPGFGYIW